MPIFVKRTRIAAPARQVFAWHRRPEALEELIPPWERVVVERRPENLRDGAVAVLRMSLGPIGFRWVAEHRGYEDRGDDGGRFTDIQVRGPFASWEHRHTVEPAGPDASVLEDHVTYELPFGFLGRWFGAGLTTRKLERMFEFRHQVTKEANETAR